MFGRKVDVSWSSMPISIAFMFLCTIVVNPIFLALDSNPLQPATKLEYYNIYHYNDNMKYRRGIHLQQCVADLRFVRLGYEGLGLRCDSYECSIKTHVHV